MGLATLWTLAGISWDPEIRGILTVAVGLAVLGGSVWLMLATNVGARVATLLALAGFFGWMAIMGAVWWIYGIGWTGSDPSWQTREINVADITQAHTGPASDLADAQLTPAPGLVERYCPGLVDDYTEVAERRTATDDFEIPLPASDRPEFCTEQVGELLATNTVAIEQTQRERNDLLADDDPRKLTPAELESDIEARIADDQRRRAGLTLSGLATVSPEIIEQAEADGLVDFAGWRLLSTAEAGEAQAVADVALRDSFFPAGNYVVLESFQEGGKRGRSGDSYWDAVVYKVRTTLQFWNPTNYAVVQVQRTIDKEPIPGEPPPFPEANPDEPVISVVLVRDLGNLRVPPGMVTIGSLLIFLVLCWMLHLRDRQLAAHLAEA